ncbi:MAG: helix-turn-helix domain-containing protein [Bacteroidota bacterium]
MLYKLPDKGDPSDVLQHFPQFNLQLLCCRYWWLKKWEFSELSYPYWRIYWNALPGASIYHNKQETKLDEKKIVMIAPNTSYSTRILDHPIPDFGFSLEGGRIASVKDEKNRIENNAIPHLFIHFNIGIPYDNFQPQVIELEISNHWFEKLTIIIRSLITDHRKFDFFTALNIRSLILDLLSTIPEKEWELISKNERILKVLSYIETHLNEDLSNGCLAEKANFATNAFNRLFRLEVGVSPQKFVKKKRIDKACTLLDHSQNSIEQVAEKTGFSDRYHFSKIFKQVTGVSPAKYRKEFSI